MYVLPCVKSKDLFGFLGLSKGREINTCIFENDLSVRLLMCISNISPFEGTESAVSNKKRAYPEYFRSF